MCWAREMAIDGIFAMVGQEATLSQWGELSESGACENGGTERFWRFCHTSEKTVEGKTPGADGLRAGAATNQRMPIAGLL